MLPTIEIIVLAIIQGIGEFLPISSSGHFVVISDLFATLGEELPVESLTMNIVLHLGTLLAIVVVYWKKILFILREERRMIPLILVGSVPTAIIGIFIEKMLGEYLNFPLFTGFMFLVTGGLLLWAKGKVGDQFAAKMSYRQSLLIGLFQGLAVFPGISRSGATIIAGLFCGLRRDEAASFSFLLAIPAIGGAGLLEALKLLDQTPNIADFSLLTLGAVVSFAVGVVSLLWLLKWLNEGRLYLFAYWVFFLGLVVIAWKVTAGMLAG